MNTFSFVRPIINPLFVIQKTKKEMIAITDILAKSLVDFAISQDGCTDDTTCVLTLVSSRIPGEPMNASNKSSVVTAMNTSSSNLSNVGSTGPPSSASSSSSSTSASTSVSASSPVKKVEKKPTETKSNVKEAPEPAKKKTENKDKNQDGNNDENKDKQSKESTQPSADLPRTPPSKKKRDSVSSVSTASGATQPKILDDVDKSPTVSTTLGDAVAFFAADPVLTPMVTGRGTEALQTQTGKGVVAGEGGDGKVDGGKADGTGIVGEFPEMEQKNTNITRRKKEVEDVIPDSKLFPVTFASKEMWGIEDTEDEAESKGDVGKDGKKEGGVKPDADDAKDAVQEDAAQGDELNDNEAKDEISSSWVEIGNGNPVVSTFNSKVMDDDVLSVDGECAFGNFGYQSPRLALAGRTFGGYGGVPGTWKESSA